MDSEAPNPWEGIRCDSPVESFKDSPEFFNNIKLHDFPFLKSHFSFVDYLVRCNVCKVILLPETVYSHYETRHATSVNVECTPGFLPYEAVSQFNDAVDASSKIERTSGIKRVRASGKRTKRSVRATGHELLQFEAVSETDSLSSLTDDTSKRVSNTASEEETDRMREPVLLKLAKTDGSAVQPDVSGLLLPKAADSSCPSNCERSVWSVVYGTDPGLSDATKKTNLKFAAPPESSDADQNLPDSGLCSHSSDSGIGSLSLCTLRPSSYPPTPSMTPPLSSPVTSHISDELLFVGLGHNLDVRRDHRPASRSSTHSSSSGGFTGSQDRESRVPSRSSLQSIVGNQTPFTASQGGRLNRHVPKIGRRFQRSQSMLADHCIPSCSTLSSCITEDNDVEVDPYTDYVHRMQADTCFVTSGSVSEVRKPAQQDLVNRNGYHAWLKNLRGSQTFPASNSAISRPLLHPQFIPRQSRNMDGSHGTPETLLHRNLLSVHQGVPSVKCLRTSSWRSRLSGVRTLNTMSGVRCGGITTNIGTSLDPAAQCNCVEVGELSYHNPVICPVHHSVDEKHQIVRQKDLRTLMREARERVQQARQNLSLQKHRQGTGSFQNFEQPQTVIDLTEDFPVSSDANDAVSDPVEAEKLRLRLVSGGQLRPPHRVLYQAASGETKQSYTARIGPVDIAGAAGSNTLASRLSHRASLCDEPMTFNQTSPYTNEIAEYAIAGACSNAKLGSGEQFTTIQQSPHPNEPYFDESGAIVIGDPSTGYPQNRLITFPKRQSSGVMEFGTTMNRKQQRRQVVRRSHVAPIQSVQQWSPHITHHSGETSVVGPPFVDSSNSPLVDDIISEQETASTNLLSTPSQVVDPRISMLAPPLGSQVVTGGSESMLITSSGSQISYDGRNLMERQPHHLMPLINQPVIVNRFNRSVYGGTHVIRETQGRVIVDDMREKSITGRSRKTAKSTFRHATPVFPPPNYSTIIPTRFTHPISQHQTNATFLAVNRKPSTIGLLSNRSTVVSRSLLSSSTSDLFANTLAHGSDFESTETIGSVRPPFVSHSILRPTRLSTVRGSTVVASDAGSYPSFLGTNVMDSRTESDFVDMDYCIESSSLLSATNSHPAHSPALTDTSEYNSEQNVSTTFAHQDSRPSTSTAHSLPAVGGQSIATGETVPPSVSRNRYFVIRPNSLRQPPSLVLRAKRPESCSLPHSVYKPSDM
ncbi:hypothetical protein CRM22_002419 [Opisthorchis felineus]|uniref:SCA7 domain-containing protein n=1 Tax=Opisthorchis felineus TaxID=147828 RepID=A0A4S2M641_OPIFE|nr:hypothetical protein CRM22_002419 [Opisthorchis felineus]